MVTLLVETDGMIPSASIKHDFPIHHDDGETDQATADPPKKRLSPETHVYVYRGKTFEHVPKCATHVCLHPTIREIPKLFFVRYANLCQVQLNLGLLSVGDMCFWNCTSLQQLIIPSTVISIGRKALADCASLQHVDLPLGLLTLGDSVFSNCISLQTISLPSSLVEIRKRAFENCIQLNLVELRNGLEIIGEMAFQGCASLMHIHLPITLKAIGQCAFAKCTQLLSVEMPKKIASIGYSSFSQCDSLRNIIIPKTSNSFGNHMFGSHSMLEKQFPHRSNLWSVLKRRFEGLPLHQVCYSHPYHPTLHTIRKLSRALQKGADPATRDDFGLTPFHLLALSTKLDLHVWMTLMQGTNATQLVHAMDCWGCSPLYYLCVNNVINSTEVLRYVVRSSIEHRLGSVGFLEQWKLQLIRMVHELSDQIPVEEKLCWMNEIYSQLTVFLWREKVSLLELALWKHAIRQKEASSMIVHPFGSSQEEEERLESRITCGIEVVSSNVLPFLGDMELEKISW